MTDRSRRPLCSLCGLEDGACICHSIRPATAPQALAATPALEPGWLQKSIDAAAERAAQMPDWMTRPATPAVGGERIDAAAIHNILDGYWFWEDTGPLHKKEIADAIIALAATPEVGGEYEELANEIKRSDGLFCRVPGIGMMSLGATKTEMVIAALRAQPASPLRGTDNPLRSYTIEQLQFELAIRATWKAAAPPEQPAAYVCETCSGTGEIDQRLGGTPTSGIVECPDCQPTAPEPELPAAQS